MKKPRAHSLTIAALLVVAASGCGQDVARTDVAGTDVEEKSSPLVAADVIGTWYLNANGSRIEAQISGSGNFTFTGTLKNQNGGTETLTNIAVNGSFLEFRRDGAGFF